MREIDVASVLAPLGAKWVRLYRTGALRVCGSCSGPYAPRSAHHRYCEGACRQRALRRRQRRGPGFELLACECCGVPYLRKRAHGRFCGGTCRKRAHRRRERGRPPGAPTAPAAEAVRWFALVDFRTGASGLDHGEMYLDEETAGKAFANALEHQPELEPFLSLEELAKSQ